MPSLTRPAADPELVDIVASRAVAAYRSVPYFTADGRRAHALHVAARYAAALRADTGVVLDSAAIAEAALAAAGDSLTADD